MIARIRRGLTWLLTLSPEGRAFFYASFLVHVALKLLLGLRLSLEDGYGMRSLVAPPQSLVFTSGDVLVCFGFARLIDLAPATRRRPLHLVCLPPLFGFLVANFIVHTYFKSFVNRGLLEFNGAGTTELVDYALSGLNVYSLGFIAVALVLLGLFAAKYTPVAHAAFTQRQAPVYAMLVLATLGLLYGGRLSRGQTGWIAMNPAYVLVRSYALGSGKRAKRATPAELRVFEEPRGMGGRYELSVDVQIAQRPRSNVLFLLIESLPLEQTSLGDKPDQLPVLHELAQDGVSFDQFRTVFPATSRSFLTSHCGIYPTTDAATATKYSPGYRCESIVDRLKGAGYRTGFFTAPMFTYDNLHQSSVIRSYDRYADFAVLQKKARRNEVSAPAVEEEVVVNALLDFINEDDDKPWFATYFLFWNHAPYRLPFEDISTLPDLERYKRTLTYLNTIISDLLARARKQGKLDDTIVIVTADHGEGFGLHHRNVNHVGHLYEDDVRVPFLIHLPGIGRHVCSRNASNVDLAPTLMNLLGLPRAESWQGQDLLSASYEDRPTLLFGRASFSTNGLVDGNYKYIEYTDGSARYLYDLDVDPHEQRNLLGRDMLRANRYRDLIQKWLPVVEAKAWAVSERSDR